MNGKSIHQLSLNADEELLTRKRKRVKEPNYFRIGNGTVNKHNIRSIDLIVEIVKCSKPAQTVVMWIKDGMTWNPYDERIDFVVKVQPDTSAGKKVLAKGFKELSEKDLVRRVKRSHFMINPNALITDYEAQRAQWDQLESPTMQ